MPKCKGEPIACHTLEVVGPSWSAARAHAGVLSAQGMGRRYSRGLISGNMEGGRAEGKYNWEREAVREPRERGQDYRGEGDTEK